MSKPLTILLSNCLNLNHKSKQLVFIICLVATGQFLNSQNSAVKDSLDIQKVLFKIKNLYENQEFKELVGYTSIITEKFHLKSAADSISLSEIYNYEQESYYELNQLLNSISSAEKGLRVCPVNETTSTLRAYLYYDKAVSERDSDLSRKSYKSGLESLRILESQNPQNNEDLIEGYLFLSSEEAYYGNLEEAERYIRLADKIYQKDKKVLDKSRREQFGENFRYELVLLYRKVYLLYSLGDTKQDSLRLENDISRLKYLQSQPEFGKNYESIYYNTALNHAADWFLKKHETSRDDDTAYLKRGTTLINEVVDLAENKGYGGNLAQFKYNKCKALTYANELEAADRMCNEVFSILEETDQRVPFFYAQKGLIKAKLNQKDSALIAFKESIKGVHKGEAELASDFQNFKPSLTFGHTILLCKIADKLSKHFKDDKEIQQLALKIYYLALSQLESSFLEGKYNVKTDLYLKKIISGILKLRKQGFGYNDSSNRDLLNKIEIVRNQNEWKRFNQNRYTNNLPALDSITFKELELRSALVEAKKTKNIKQQDSLKNAFRVYEDQVKSKYPNLELLSTTKFSISKLQEKLGIEDVVLKYLLVDEELITYMITKHTIDFSLKPWKQKEKEQLELFLDNLKQKKFSDSTARQLGELLIPDIKAYKNVIVNPDKALFKLPFEAIILKDTYLFEKFNVRYTSNLSFISPKVIENLSDKSLAIYAPRYAGTTEVSPIRSLGAKLDGAKQEAQIISKYFNSKIYDSPGLNKYDFIKTSSKAKLLHLAMHAEINNQQPELSKFLFPTNAMDDKDLYLEEIYGLNLSADLAVLSACNTGVGKENLSRSLESFQRAFTFAGVPATVASLWEVPDLATKEIMISFYENLKEGQVKSQALKNAKLKYQSAHEHTKLAQPYFWAGFVLYGDDSTIVEGNDNLIWYKLLGVCGLIMGVLLFYKHRQKTLKEF